jgi:hypothetical protein
MWTETEQRTLQHRGWVMARTIQYGHFRANQSFRNTGYLTLRRFSDFLYSLIATALLIGFIWSVGYVLYLLLLNELIRSGIVS